MLGRQLTVIPVVILAMPDLKELLAPATLPDHICPWVATGSSLPSATGIARDQDGSHLPSWTKREFPSTITRREVLDDHNWGADRLPDL
jgi:hypothetical protein